MERRSERGVTLIESVVAAGAAGMAVVAFASVMAGFGRFAAHGSGPVRTAAAALADRTLRVAQDAWKYGSPGSAPTGALQTTVPLVRPDGSATAAPVSVTVLLSGAGPESAHLTVTVRYTPDPDRQDPGTFALSGEAVVQAPLPASTISPPGLVPNPAGAP